MRRLGPGRAEQRSVRRRPSVALWSARLARSARAASSGEQRLAKSSLRIGATLPAAALLLRAARTAATATVTATATAAAAPSTRPQSARRRRRCNSRRAGDCCSARSNNSAERSGAQSRKPKGLLPFARCVRMCCEHVGAHAHAASAFTCAVRPPRRALDKAARGGGAHAAQASAARATSESARCNTVRHWPTQRAGRALCGVRAQRALAAALCVFIDRPTDRSSRSRRQRHRDRLRRR